MAQPQENQMDGAYRPNPPAPHINLGNREAADQAMANMKVASDGIASSAPGDERMLRWFEYAHLPPQSQAVSLAFCGLAQNVVRNIQPGPERTVALRKLLEAKDAAVRAALHPGG